MRSGKLVAIEPTKERRYAGLVVWRCRCDCGNEHYYTTTTNITCKRVKSCGCMNGERATSDGGGARTLMRTYKVLAKKRNLVWDLSPEQWDEPIHKNCHYCGVAPSQVLRASSRYYPLIYNGVDRVNSKLGYTVNNCVSCCKHCNRSKWEFTVDEWHEHMKKVLAHVDCS